MLKAILILLFCGSLFQCSNEDPLSCTTDYITHPFRKKEAYTGSKENNNLKSCFFETKEQRQQKQLEELFRYSGFVGTGSSSSNYTPPTSVEYVTITQSITSFECSQYSTTYGIPASSGSSRNLTGTCTAMGFDASMIDKTTSYSKYVCKFTNSSSVSQVLCSQVVLNNMTNRNFTWVDTIVPSISSVYPPASSTNISIFQTILITYDESLDPDTINLSNIKLTNGVTPISIIIKSNGKQVYIYPDPITSTWNNATTYTVSLSNLKDYQANQASAFAFSYTTE